MCAHVCVYVCVHVCVCARVCVCAHVCVREREREERGAGDQLQHRGSEGLSASEAGACGQPKRRGRG